MSLNPSSSSLSAFPFALLRFLLDYLDCVIVLKLWYNFYFPFVFLLSLCRSLPRPVGSQRVAAVFFKLFSLFAVFGATLSPCNTSIFVLLSFSPFFLSSPFFLFFCPLWCQSKQFLPLASLRFDFLFFSLCIFLFCFLAEKGLKKQVSNDCLNGGGHGEGVCKERGEGAKKATATCWFYAGSEGVRTSFIDCALYK